MSKLKNIEKKINEINQELIETNSRKVVVGDSTPKLQSELTTLKTKRQFLLDRRNSWLPKTIWSVLVPIIVSVVSTIIILYLTKNLSPKG